MRLSKKQWAVVFSMTIIGVGTLAVLRSILVAPPDVTMQKMVQAVRTHKWDALEPYVAMEQMELADSLKNEIEDLHRIYAPHVDGLEALDSGLAWVEYRDKQGIVYATIHYLGDHGAFPTYDVVRMVRVGATYKVIGLDASAYSRRFNLFFDYTQRCEMALDSSGQPNVDLFFAEFPEILAIAKQHQLPFLDTLLAWQKAWEKVKCPQCQ